MGKISTYTVLSTPTLNDKLIGTDTTTNDETKNFLVSDLLALGVGGTGATGPQGPQGIAGVTGAQGVQGVQGIQGSVGPIGPAGLNWQGAYSPTGTYVLNDAVGFGGASYYNILACSSCTGDPSLNTTNWALLANIGATGPQGPAGIQGIQGLTGTQGPQGVTGATGATGATGPAGASSGGNIGKLLGGGIVVAEWNESGVQKALIASVTNLSTGLEWTGNAQDSNLIGTTAQSFSNGSTNTDAIIAQTLAPAANTYAAGLARLFTDGGYNDWYLPAAWELNMCANAAAIVNKVLGDVNGFILSTYWSSTENNNVTAFTFDFYSILLSFDSKSSANCVRAVRIHNI
jgi:hypothetical protein